MCVKLRRLQPGPCYHTWHLTASSHCAPVADTGTFQRHVWSWDSSARPCRSLAEWRTVCTVSSHCAPVADDTGATFRCHVWSWDSSGRPCRGPPHHQPTLGPRGGTPGRVAVRALWGRPRLLPSAGQHHQLTLLVWSFGTTSTAHPRLVPSSSRLVVWSWDSGTCVKPQQQGDNWPYAGRETGLSSNPHLARGYLPCTAI